MRIRDIARIDGFPCGEYNAVTDVKGVRVGHSTVIKDGAGPVLDDGGMPHAHALDVGDGVVFPAGESVDARDVSDSHDSVPCCQLKDQWTCVT